MNKETFSVYLKACIFVGAILVTVIGLIECYIHSMPHI